MTNDESNPKSAGRSQQPFPLWLCVASIAATSLGLVAAAIGIKWGAAPVPGDALREAWPYVQVTIALTWLVVWPALGRAANTRDLAAEFGVAAISSLPAMSVAAVLSSVPASAIFASALWQFSCGAFAFVTLALGTRRRALPLILPVIALALPVAAYLLSDFFALAPPRALWPH